MDISNSWWWLGLLLQWTLLTVTRGDLCVLPETLTAKSNWELRITRYRIEVGSHVTFSENKMEEVTYGFQTVKVTRECIEDYGGNTYLFTMTDATTNTIEYQCYMFMIRTKYVVQIKTSSIVNSLEESESLCDPSNLRENPWLMIIPRLERNEQKQDCGFQGGFNFHTFVNTHQFTYCNKNWVKPRLEVGCLNTHTIYLDFRGFGCQGTLDMDAQQHLQCLSSWVQDNYTFTVVTNDDFLFPKLWLLRLPKDIPSESTFDIICSESIYVDTSPEYPDEGNVHKFIATYSDFPTTCEDEAQKCDTCQTDAGTKFYCMRTCDACEKDLDDCEFNQSFQGEWQEVDKERTRHLTITNSIIYPDGISPWQCLNLPTSEGMPNRHAMASFYKNGCKPRYVCSELVPRGDNLLQVRFSKMLSWPYKLNINTQDICANDLFVDEPAASHPYQSEHFKLLVRAISQSRERETVNCGVLGEFSFLRRSNSSQCTGTLRSCDFRDVFHVEHSEDCYIGPVKSTYHCIGAFDEGDTHFIITENEDNADDLNCWAVYKEPGGTLATMYKLFPSDCTESIVGALRHANESYQAIFHIKLESGLQNEASCRPAIEVPKTTMGELERETSTTMLAPSEETTNPKSAPDELMTTNNPKNVETQQGASKTNQSSRIQVLMSVHIILMSVIILLV